MGLNRTTNPAEVLGHRRDIWAVCPPGASDRRRVTAAAHSTEACPRKIRDHVMAYPPCPQWRATEASWVPQVVEVLEVWELAAQGVPWTTTGRSEWDPPCVVPDRCSRDVPVAQSRPESERR